MKPRNVLFVLACASVIITCGARTLVTQKPEVEPPSDTQEISPELIRHPKLDKTYWTTHRRGRSANKKHPAKTCSDAASSMPPCEHA